MIRGPTGPPDGITLFSPLRFSENTFYISEKNNFLSGVSNCPTPFSSGIWKDVKIAHSRLGRQKMLGTIGKHCEIHGASHKRPFVPSVGAVGLLCNV